MPERVHHEPKMTPETVESEAAREQQDRYRLLLTEHRYAEFAEAVKSEDVPPDTEIVRAEYATLDLRENFAVIHLLYRATGIKYEADGERALQHVKECLDREVLDRVKDMQEFTDYRVPDTLIHQYYTRWLEQGRIGLLELAIHTLGIKPEFSEKAVQQAFAWFVGEASVNDIKTLKKITGVVPSVPPRVLQEGFRIVTHFFDAAELIEVTGAVPDPVTTQELYWRFGWQDMDGFAELIKRTGTPPTQETADEIYFRLIQARGASRIAQMKTIAPCRLDRERLYGAYGRIIRDGFGDELPQITQAIGVPAPREVIVHQIERAFLESSHRALDTAAAVVATLHANGVVLTPEEAERYYRAILVGGEPSDLKKLVEYTGVPVSADAVRVGYIARYKDVHVFVHLREAIGIEPPVETVERLYRHYLDSDPKKLPLVRDTLGLLPQPEWVQTQYREVLTHGPPGMWLTTFAFLMEATWIKPEEATIALAVRQMIQPFKPEMLAFIRDLYGGTIPGLDTSQVQQAYQGLFRPHNADPLGSALKLHEITRVPIAISKEQSQLALFGALQSGEIARAVQFYDACSEKPEWKNVQVEIGYEEAIGAADATGIKLLRERSGIGPIPEAIRRGYGRLFERMRNLQNFADVVALVGPPPDMDDVQKGYALAYKTLYVDGVKIIEKATGIAPAPETLQQAYQHFIANGELSKLDSLGVHTGVVPQPETVQEGLFAAITNHRSGGWTGYRKLIQRFGAPERDTFLRIYDVLLRSTDVNDDVDLISRVLAAFPDNPDAKPSPKQAQVLYAKLITRADIEKIDWFVRETGVPFEATPEARAAVQIELGEIARRLSPKAYVKRYNTLKAFWPPGESLPVHPNAWTEMYMRLAKLQAPALREEYDPWENELTPLLGSQHSLDTARDEDAEILYDFVREYGMYNLPTILTWHAALRRARTIADIPMDVKGGIENALKIVLDRLPNPGAVVVEIKRFRRRIQEELLLDRVPREIVGTAVGRELFDSLKGSTRWGQNDSTYDLVQTWVETMAARPDVAALGEGHQPVRMEVTQAVSKSAEEVRDEEDRIKEIVNNPEVVAALERMDAALKQTMSLHTWWQRAREGVIQLIDAEIAVLERSLGDAGDNEKKKKGIHGKLLVWRTKREEVTVLEPPESVDDHERFMEDVRVVVPEKMAARDDLLRGVSARLIREEMAEGWYDRLTAIGHKRPPPWTVAHVQEYADILVNYINEHFLHPDQQDHTRTRHAPFSKELLRELRGVWGLRGELKTNPLVQAADRIRRIQEGSADRKGPSVDVELVPARGVLRIFAGDVGDACYTSQHEFLARGGVPGITAYTFVTGRGTTNERLRGSVLVVETKTRDGKKALVVRANNPQENLLGQVDSAELIKKTLDEMIELARRRGADVVAVPVSGQGGAATNRGAVTDYYRREFGGRQLVGLVQEPETKFNGYDIWDVSSYNGVSVIWERQ